MTFDDGRLGWLEGLGRLRNVVRQELIARQLDRHLPDGPVRVLDVGAGQGTQSLRLARAGHRVLAVEPDAQMRSVLEAALSAEPADVRSRVAVRAGSVSSLAAVTGGSVYDVVLLLGVLMYLPASPPGRTGGRRWPRSRSTTGPARKGATCATSTRSAPRPAPMTPTC